MDSLYYKEYFRLEREHWWFRARAEILMDLVRKVSQEKRKLKILNVGVATGRTSELLEQFGTVKSVEYDKACFEFVRENLDIDIINGSILELPFEDNSFDWVCAFDVIEHVDDDKKAVEEMQRVCKPGGHVFVTVPAFMSLWSKHDEVNHHFRRYKMDNLSVLFQGGLFQYKSYFNFWLFPPIYLFRRIRKWFPEKGNEENSGSDFEAMKGNGFINSLLYFVFKTEMFFTGKKIGLPFGVSLLSIWRKS